MDDMQEFYAAHVRDLTLQLFACTGDYAAAQDAVQEAFCRAPFGPASCCTGLLYRRSVVCPVRAPRRTG